MASARDKLKDQIDTSTKGFAFDALIGTLSDPPKPAERDGDGLRRERGEKQPKAESPPPGSENTPKSAPEVKREKAASATKASAKRTAAKNTTVEITSNYCRLDLDVSDRLARLQTPAEQVMYNRLYRLSYGEGKNTCTIGMTRLVEATGIRSPKTIAKALAGLIEKRHIEIQEDHHNNPKGGTTYQVFLPGEIQGIRSKTKTNVTDA